MGIILGTGREDKLDDRIRKILGELGRAVYDAMSDSADVKRNLTKLRRGGYSLHLMINCKRGEDDSSVLEVSSQPRQGGRKLSMGFDPQDDSFLRSIGIDPTRYLREHTD